MREWASERTQKAEKKDVRGDAYKDDMRDDSRGRRLRTGEKRDECVEERRVEEVPGETE